jgi:3-hydroxyacyl-[acyl-carrier-protein] dehydratase
MSLISGAVRASSTKVELCVDPDEPVFAGHYPGQPILPGVFIIDAVCRAVPDMDLAGVESVRFRRPVEPGDHVVAELTWRNRVRCTAVVTVGGVEVARMTLRFRAEDAS